MRVPRLVVGGHEGAPVGELGALGRTVSIEGRGSWGPLLAGPLVRPPPRGDPSWRASHLEEGVGAGAVEAVGPGVERGHKGAAFQGAAPGAGPLLALPAPHGALAGVGRGGPEWWGRPRVFWASRAGCLGLRLPLTPEPPRPPIPSCPHQVRQASAVTAPGAYATPPSVQGHWATGTQVRFLETSSRTIPAGRSFLGLRGETPPLRGPPQPAPQEGLSPFTPPVPPGLHTQRSAPSCRQAPTQGPPPPSSLLGPPPRGHPSLSRGLAHVAVST